MRHLWILLTLLAFLASNGCGSMPLSRAVNSQGKSKEPEAMSQAGAGKSTRFRWIKCEYGNLPVEIDCGQLTVPVDRANPQTGRIRLAVTILRSGEGKENGERAAPEPVAVLAGQPGSAATLRVQDWLENPILKTRDIILMDLRGTGKSQANLNCPELEKNNPGDLNALQACRQRLEKEDFRLDAYTSAQTAADLNDLRQALGYENWNVLGISYGTRVALTLLRDFPQGVRSVVLDSVYPLEVNVLEEQAINAAQAIQALFNGCHHDPQCAYVYPDLDQVFSDLLVSLDKDPKLVDVADPRTGEIVAVSLDGDRMASLIQEALNTPETLARIPYIIYETQYGNAHAIAGLMFPGSGNQVNPSMQESKLDRRAFTEGAYFSVLCAEEVGFNKRSMAKAAVREIGLPLAERLYREVDEIFDSCEAWNVKTADEIETQAVASPIPVLILSGEYDPLTPTKWARLAAENLPDSDVLVFPGVGHRVLNLGVCPQKIVADFFLNPTTLPDISCINDNQVEFWLP
jgi:pimeloyl-ACP methyl ester carboxylesterase